MAFCKYCGKEIPEGGQCGCNESQMTQKNNQDSQNKKTGAQSTIINDCVNDILGIMVNPIGCIEDSIKKTNQTDGFLLFGINVFLVFIASAFTIFSDNCDQKNIFLCGFELALVIGCLHLLLSGFIYIKKSVEASFSQVFGTYCLTTIPCTMVVIVGAFLYLIKLPVAWTITRYCWATSSAVYGYLVFKALTKNCDSKNTLNFVIAQFIACVIYSVGYYVI